VPIITASASACQPPVGSKASAWFGDAVAAGGLLGAGGVVGDHTDHVEQAGLLAGRGYGGCSPPTRRLR
jgi:hypothetical protein